MDTWDLYRYSLCPKRWSEEDSLRQDSPARELIKQTFLLRALGRSTGWTPKGIATIWDEIFWKGKKVTRETIDQSVSGVIATKKLYNSLPKGDFKVESTELLTTSIDSTAELRSSGDFILNFSDRIEIWIYGKYKINDIRKGCWPALEYFLFQKKMRGPLKKPFFFIMYYAPTKGTKPFVLRIRVLPNFPAAEKIAVHLVNGIKKKVFYPISGDCKECSLQCP